MTLISQDDHFIAGTWAAFDSFQNLVHAQCLTAVFSSGPGRGPAGHARGDRRERERALGTRLFDNDLTFTNL